MIPIFYHRNKPIGSKRRTIAEEPLFGAIVTWIVDKKIKIVDDSGIPFSMKFLILFGIFLLIYIVFTVYQLRPNRYKFRMKDINILVEYLGDTVRVKSTYTFSTNRFKTNCMYTRREWFSNEKFKFEPVTEGYKIKKIGSLGNTHEYHVVFPKYQYFWETKKYECEFVGNNKKRQYCNFYWYDVTCPTEKLTIEVHIPQNYCTDKIELKTFLTYEKSDGSEKEVLDFNGAYKWEVTPKLGWSYKFEWFWSESELRRMSKIKKKGSFHNVSDKLKRG